MFEWQVGNTTRFMYFKDLTGINVADMQKGSFEAVCGATSQILPASEYERFMEELKIWRDNR